MTGICKQGVLLVVRFKEVERGFNAFACKDSVQLLSPTITRILLNCAIIYGRSILRCLSLHDYEAREERGEMVVVFPDTGFIKLETPGFACGYWFFGIELGINAVTGVFIGRGPERGLGEVIKGYGFTSFNCNFCRAKAVRREFDG